MSSIAELEIEFQKVNREFENLSSFFYDSPSINIIGNREEVIKINGRLEEYLGISGRDFMSLGWKHFIHPHDIAITKNSYIRESYEMIINRYKNISKRYSDEDYMWVFWNVIFSTRIQMFLSSGMIMINPPLPIEKFLIDLGKIREAKYGSE